MAELILNHDEAETLKQTFWTNDLSNYFAEMEAFHGVTIKVVDVSPEIKQILLDEARGEKACDPHWYSLD